MANRKTAKKRRLREEREKRFQRLSFLFRTNPKELTDEDLEWLVNHGFFEAKQEIELRKGGKSV